MGSWIDDFVKEYEQKEDNMVAGGTEFLKLKDNYLLTDLQTTKHPEPLIIGKKKKFTITEGLKMFEIINSHKKDSINNQSFWAHQENNSFLPARTAD